MELIMLTEDELKKIAALAHIELDKKSTEQFADDINSIMNFIEQLRQIDTTKVEPLLHPLNLKQRLRKDEAEQNDRRSDLAKVAPQFADDLYLVPKLGPFANEGK
jgi:aspartyl-tRNA(Asn)/glutamyl-tRNA(Gln) amidotransferase subunit C